MTLLPHLRVFRGTESETVGESRFSQDGAGADVIPISAFLPRRGGLKAPTVPLRPLTRARALHANRACPFCRHPVVEPVVLNDGLRDGTGQYIPGSATLVGFHCDRCHSEWPVAE